MPPRKNVSSLTEISISSLSKFIVKALDPQFLKFLASNETHKSDVKKKNVHESLCDDIENSELDFPKNEDAKGTTDFPNSTTSMEEKVEEYLVCLIQHLTSHAHCSLQEDLFWSILTPLNRLYIKHRCKKMRKLIRKIVPYFINSYVRIMDFGSFKMLTEESMFEILYGRLKEARGLEKLMFGRSCYWRSDCILNLSEILLKMNHLRILHIHYICHPKMLEGLADSCPQLRELSLKGSKEITDKEVPSISQFHNLETLDISGTSVTGKGCRNLVLKMPKLTWLMHCPFNCNSDTLIFESRAELFSYIKDQIQRQPALIPHNNENNGSELNLNQNDPLKAEAKVCKNESGKENDSLALKLKNFWLFNASTEEIFLTHLCPQLEFLRLDFVLQDLPEQPDMDAIRHINTLSSLALYAYDRCPIQLVTNVIESSTQLTTLHLHLGDEWFFVSPIVNVIAQFCSKLTHLTMEGDYKGQHTLEESDSRLDFTLPAEKLSKLTEVRLAGCITDLRLLHLLTQAPYIQKLYLDGELEWLHDDTITEAIDRNLLQNVEVLWFNVSAGITFSSVRRLLQAQNDLKKIGRLCLMSNASKEGYINLLSFTKKHNLSTELIWVTDQRELNLDTIS